MVRQILNPGADMTQYQLQIASGGIAADNAPVGLDNIGGVARTQRNAASGVLGLDASGIALAANLPLPPTALYTPTLQGPSLAGVGVPITVEITNYDVFTTYTLATANGSISRSGAFLTYTPATAGAATFTVNGSSYSVTVQAIAPATPTLIATVSGYDDANATVSLAGTVFAMNYGTGVQLNTDWQIATDAAFTTVVFSSLADTTNKIAWSTYGLAFNTTYYARARYRDTNSNVSGYSTTVSFSTNSNLMNVQQAKMVTSDPETNGLFACWVSMTTDATRVVMGARFVDSGGVTDCGSAYVFFRNGNTWTQEAKLVASDKATNDNFGIGTAISGDGTRILVGAFGATVSGFGSAGAAYIFTRTGTTWAQETKLVDSTPTTNNNYGISVTMNADGSRVAVAALFGDNGGTTDAGTVLVYSRSGVTWSLEATLAASDKATNNNFGTGISMTGDSSRIVISSPNSTVASISNAGCAYVFSRSGTTWTQEAILSASDKATNDKFGQCAAISADGSRVIIGTINATITGSASAGAVYIYSRSGTTWSQEAKLTASDKAASAIFGVRVSMNADGSAVVVGSSGATVSGLTSAGAAYYFTRSNTTWTQISKSTASDPQASGFFGYAVGISGDSSNIVVGGYGYTVSGFTVAGAAYAFSGYGYRLDKEEAKLIASDKAAGDNFGHSIAISNDGTRVVVGAYNATVSSTTQAGAAYVFVKLGTTWTQEAKLVASTLEAVAGLGVSVGITADGSRATAGAWKVDAGAVVDAGGVYVFLRTGTSWAQEAKLVASDPVTNAQMGQYSALSADGTRIIAGCSADNSNKGAVYIFSRSGTTWSQETKIVTGESVSGDLFGGTVNISADSTRVVIGARGVSYVNAVAVGAIYVYSRSGTAWTLEQKFTTNELLASGALSGTFAIAISGDGTRIAAISSVVVNGNTITGVYVFLRTGTVWTQETFFAGTDTVSGDNFGVSVSLSTDGSKLIVGSPLSSPSSVTNAGSAYIFTRSGTTWTQESKIVASDKATGDRFGFSVAISGDATRTTIGARFNSPSSLSQAGAAYITS